MDPNKLSTISVSNSGGAFLFGVLFVFPILAIITGVVSIVTGIWAIHAGGPKVKSYVAIGLSVLWLLVMSAFLFAG